MKIIPSNNIFKLILSPIKNEDSHSLSSIIYNSNLTLCLNREYIEEIEAENPNNEYFKSIITLLNDNNRLDSTLKFVLSASSKFEQLALNSNKISMLFPLAYNDKIDNNIFCFDYKNINSDILNKEFVIYKLAIHNSLQISHTNFVDNEHIQNFLDSLFSLPCYIQTVKIYNRDVCCKFLSKLKGKNILYYSLQSGKMNTPDYQLMCKDKKDEIKKELGGRSKLFVTPNKRIIHERKIFINDHIIITFDNSFENILKEEPTWTISIELNPSLHREWYNKDTKFKEINCC